MTISAPIACTESTLSPTTNGQCAAAAAAPAHRPVVQKCCRLQASSNGAEHDLKCNLYKAQLMQQQQKQQQVDLVHKSSLNSSKMTSGVGSGANSCGSSNSCASSSSGVVMPSSSSGGSTPLSSCEKNVCGDADSADEINIDTRPTTTRGNLLDAENGLLGSEKLTDKDTNCLLKSNASKSRPSHQTASAATSSAVFHSQQIAGRPVSSGNGVIGVPQRPPHAQTRVNGHSFIAGSSGSESQAQNGKQQPHFITEI
jgi:hypothetical protein